MNCTTAKRLAALYAGGDLSPDEAEKLLRHIANCPACAHELDALKNARKVVRRATGQDSPPPLPGDFADSVLERTPAEPARKQTHRPRVIRLTPRLAVWGAAAAALIAAFVYIPVKRTHDARLMRERTVEMRRQAAIDPGTIELTDKIIESYNVDGPHPLEGWTPPGVPGIYIVMYRPEPVAQPDTYHIDYIVASNGRHWKGRNWWYRKKQNILDVAGSEANIYVAVVPMPKSSNSNRRYVADILVRKFKPSQNEGA